MAFDVVVVGGLRPWEILWHAPKIYRERTSRCARCLFIAPGQFL
jgi:hypothetical protein